jgi:hypothetical protein
MTDELEKLFQELRADTLNQIIAPGTPQIRTAVRRRRTTTVVVGTGVAVAAVLVGAGAALHPGTGSDYAVGTPGQSASGPQPPVMPEPTDPAYVHARAAGDLLTDRSKTPTSISATDGVVTSSYEGDMNDMPADTYAFHFFCVGTGVVAVVVKQGDSGDTVLGHGTATCAAHDPAPLRLTIRQPEYGYLRVFASGDARSNQSAGFALEFLSATGKTFPVNPSGTPYSSLPENPSRTASSSN